MILTKRRKNNGLCQEHVTRIEYSQGCVLC